MSNNTRVMLVDDHSIVRTGLRKMLDAESGIEVVAEAENGREAVEIAGQVNPDLVILDVAMPEMGGVEAISALRKILPELKIIILTMYGKDSIAREALRAGAQGYILKGDPGETLVKGIHAVLQGRYFFSDQIQATLVDFFRQPENESILPEERKYNALSDREKQVFRLLMEGKSVIEIGRLLDVSQKTSEKHRTSVVKKLGMSNSVDMFKYAIRIGLVDPNSFDE